MKQVISHLNSLANLTAIVSILLLSSCAVPKLALRQSAKIETLSICTSYTDDVPVKVQSTLDSTLNVFVNNFNASDHLYKLGYCNEARRSTLIIDIKETHLVSKKQQWASTFITLAGLSLPVIMIAAELPFFVFFYSFPNDVSYVDISLTPDIAPTMQSLSRNVSNSGYLISEKRQIEKHGIAYYYFLKREIGWIEKDYKRVQKEAKRKLSKSNGSKPVKPYITN